MSTPATAPSHAEHHAQVETKSLVNMQAEVAAAREEFVASVVELKAALQPAALAQRGAKAVGSWFVDTNGGVRPERVAIAAAVVVGFVGLRLLRRR